MEIKLFILDMDGTIYLGDKLFSFTKDFLSFLKKSGREYILFTNNASKSKKDYVQKLKKMDLDISEQEILTSGDVTIQFLLDDRLGKTVYLVGTSFLEQAFIDAGIILVKKDPDIVVTSFDTSLTYEKLDRACHYIRNGSEFISTHCDVNCPTEYGFMPDSGAICAAITASTGKEPRYFGKPFKETVDMIKNITGYSTEQMAIVGDRLYTDIKLGQASKIRSILVLSGETKQQDLESSAVVPDHVYKDLSFLMDDLLG